jgi:hypothetical protein
MLLNPVLLHSPARRAARLLAALVATATLGSASLAAADQPKKTKKTKAAAVTPAEAPKPIVTVVDGVVQPRRPIAEAIPDAIRFLRKADGNYRPGNIQGELAGYFMAAHVNADGSRVTRRQLSFPARHHAYFIRTFLHYYAYTGEPEWLLRARDLADWNIATSTPATDAYPNLPYSAHQDGKPTGSADQNSIETDKPAFLGISYLAVFESTGDRKYLEAAQRIAATLIPQQRPDGSWPFRVIPKDGTIFEDFGGAPVFFVEFFEALQRHGARPEYQRARDSALQLMIARNVEAAQWGTYHEDIRPKSGAHLSAEPMSFTAAYLFRNARAHPEYIGLGKRVLAQMEASLVHTEGHAASPAPGVAEQLTFAHIMAGHTARYCLALAELYRVTGDAAVKQRALSGLNAITFMQSEAGLFRTHFYDTRAKVEKDPATASNWYSQHLYTVCHMLECMTVFPEISPAGQDHILGFSSSPGQVRYTPQSVSFRATLPGTVTIKLSGAPKSVQVGGQALAAGSASQGWSFDAATRVLTLRHPAGEIVVAK